jgi:hypothetical protein
MGTNKGTKVGEKTAIRQLTARLNCQGALMAVMRPMAPRSRLLPDDDDCRTQPTNKQSYWSIKSNETL